MVSTVVVSVLLSLTFALNPVMISTCSRRSTNAKHIVSDLLLLCVSSSVVCCVASVDLVAAGHGECIYAVGAVRSLWQLQQR